MDLLSGYHQIKLKPEERPRTAFKTHNGLYEYKVMPFGLANAPSVFMATMNRILHGLPFVVVYIDDILIFSRTPEEHLEHIKAVLQRLADHNLYVKLSKCDFFKPEVSFVGYIVSADGIRPDPRKVEVVQNWPKPKTLYEVKAFLGLASYFRRFIAGFSDRAGPLLKITRGGASKRQGKVIDITGEWDDKCDAAFQDLRGALTEAPVLALPDFQKRFELISDASVFAIGAVLTQEKHAIAYESRKMSEPERRYITTDQELLAIMHALSVWRCYLEGVEFTVITDHNPLVHLKTQSNLNRRQARWVEILEQYAIAWEYRPGPKNPADPLSRLNYPVGLECELCKGHLKHSCGTGAAVERGTPGTSRGHGDGVMGAYELRKRKEHQLGAGGMGPTLAGRSRRKPNNPPSHAQTTPSHTSAGSSESGHGITSQDNVGPDSAGSSGTTSSGGEAEVYGEGFLQSLLEGYKEDAWLQKPGHRAKLQLVDNKWYHGHALFIPDSGGLRQQCIQLAHDNPMAGHPGRARTLQLLGRNFWWPRMKADIELYVQSCHQCQVVKYSTRKPQGLLQPLGIPAQPWDDVSMDFITGLPRTDRGTEQILVVTDKLTKMVHFVGTPLELTAPQLAKLLCETVFRLHGIPKRIISDRDKLLTSSFWQGVAKQLNIHQAMSTAFHPQTDGQTERVNSILEDYLRAFVNSTQSDWNDYLWLAEFAYNNAFHDSVRSTPFFLNNGRHPRTPLTSMAEALGARPAGFSDVEVASTSKTFVDDITEALAAARRCAEAAQQRQAAQANKHRRAVSLEVGDRVLLFTKNLRIHGEGIGRLPRRKLMPRFVGPFTVEKKITDVAFRLSLPATMKCHPVFHISLLRLYKGRDGDTPPPPPEFFAGEFEWEVEKIVDAGEKVVSVKGGRPKKVMWYRVRWKGYGDPYDTWEPDTHLKNAQEVVEAWNNR
jgi:hypothetical protein